MVRAFDGRPVDPATVDRLLDGARRAPAAGNTSGRAFVVLEGAETGRYWDVTLPPERRRAFAWPGLLRAPVLVLILTSPAAYVARYAEPDKAGQGALGEAEGAWPVPYWHVDGGMGVMALLLGAVDAGLGACFFGLFDQEAAVLGALGVPDGWRAVGTVALGHSAPDRPGRSHHRRRPDLSEVVHRGTW